jgi:hypothetical protein
MDAFIFGQPIGSWIFWKVMHKKDSRGVGAPENFGGGKKAMFDCVGEGLPSFFTVARRRSIIAGVINDCSSAGLL